MSDYKPMSDAELLAEDQRAIEQRGGRCICEPEVVRETFNRAARRSIQRRGGPKKFPRTTVYIAHSDDCEAQMPKRSGEVFLGPDGIWLQNP